MQAARVFFVSSLFTYRALFQWLNPSAYIFSKIGFPLIQMTFFAIIGSYSGARPLAFYLVGNAVLVAYRPMFTIATSIANERRGGTLPYVVASPANRVALFFGRSAFHVVDGIMDVAIAILYAAVIFGLDLSHANWVGLSLALLAATFGASAVGLFLGAMAYLILDATFLANTAMFVLLLLAGANIPLSDLPPFLLPLSWALPVTRSVEASREFVAGADLAPGVFAVGGDVLIGAAWAIAGLVLFQWIELQARKRGTLEGE